MRELRVRRHSDRCGEPAERAAVAVMGLSPPTVQTGTVVDRAGWGPGGSPPRMAARDCSLQPTEPRYLPFALSIAAQAVATSWVGSLPFSMTAAIALPKGVQ